MFIVGNLFIYSAFTDKSNTAVISRFPAETVIIQVG
jgi:hypothetical protein